MFIFCAIVVNDRNRIIVRYLDVEVESASKYSGTKGMLLTE